MSCLGKKIVEAGKYSIAEIEHLYTVALRDTFKNLFSEEFLNSYYFKLDYANPIVHGQETDLVLTLMANHGSVTKEQGSEQRRFLSAIMFDECKLVTDTRNATLRELKYMTQRMLGYTGQLTVCLKLQDPTINLYQANKAEKVFLFVSQDKGVSVA